jgi:hypothetical protein
LRETVKNIDSLAATLDVRLQELNKTYTIFTKIIAIIRYTEFLESYCNDLAKIIESEVLKRPMAKIIRPEKIKTDDLNW